MSTAPSTRDMTPLEIMTKLISFPTVSRDSNLELVDWVEAYLGELGIRSWRVPNEDGTKAAIYASVGPDAPGGVVLSGHTDVVPVDGQDWTSDPFTVTARDGRYYGRGTCDMKGFDALALWSMSQAAELASRGALEHPLQIALSYDEEIGCTGAPPMIDHMVANPDLPKAEAAVIGEPSTMQAVTAHKGGFGYNVHVRGFEVHSSLQHIGVSAVLEGARVLNWINDKNDEIRSREPTPVAAMFEPPFTTVHSGMVQGGTASNITAADCRFTIDFRNVPGDDPEQYRAGIMEQVAWVEAGMKAVRPESGIDVSPRFEVPGLKPEEEGAAEALVRSITGDNGKHVVSYGTEAGQFQERGYSSVICGPGDIAQAHQPDEFIEISEFNAGHAFMRQLLKKLSRN